MSLTIRPVEPKDRAAWNALYAGYAAFYKVTQTPEMRDTVWSWLNNPAHETNGFVAEDETGKLIASPITGPSRARSRLPPAAFSMISLSHPTPAARVRPKP